MLRRYSLSIVKSRGAWLGPLLVTVMVGLVGACSSDDGGNSPAPSRTPRPSADANKKKDEPPRGKPGPSKPTPVEPSQPTQPVEPPRPTDPTDPTRPSGTSVPDIATWVKATDLSDAKQVVCAGDSTTLYLDFSEALLQRGDWGDVRGTLGTVRYGIWKDGDTTYEPQSLDSPTLIVNGPTTKIQVYDYSQNLVGWAKTQNFITGEGELSVDGVVTAMSCVYYQQN